MVYEIYGFLIVVYVIIVFIDNIKKQYLHLYHLAKYAFNNPTIVRDLSLGTFINGLFSMLNATALVAILGYLVLTFVSLVGIINANRKIQKEM